MHKSKKALAHRTTATTAPGRITKPKRALHTNKPKHDTKTTISQHAPTLTNPTPTSTQSSTQFSAARRLRSKSIHHTPSHFFTVGSNDNYNDNNDGSDTNTFTRPTTTSLKITKSTKNRKPDALDHISIGDMVPHSSGGDFKYMVAKRPSQKQKKENDRLVNTLYGDFVDAHDRGDGLAWAAGTDEQQSGTKTGTNGGGADATELAAPLHEQILQLYLNNYQEQETRELEAHFGGSKLDHEFQNGRDQFLQQIVNTMPPRNYSRFVHSFRVCIQRLRTLLSKHQQQKQHLKDNIHLVTNLAFQEKTLQSRYQNDLQETQINFFRQAAKLFGEHADVFMPQLVIYLSSLTLTQLENHRERQSTSQMNLYSCGFWTPHPEHSIRRFGNDDDDGGNELDVASMNPTTAFRQQFRDYLEENNPTKGTNNKIPTENVALEAYTFPVRIANKLYADLDIHTDQTSPVFFNKLARTHQRSYKVFVSNIPSTLTTRELMALFGNCGVLNAAEIYRDKLDQNSGTTLEKPLTQPSTLATMPGDDNLYQGLNLSKKEAIVQANAAALTIDISDIALGHFTSSFKSERLLVPSHVIDGKLIDAAVKTHNTNQLLLGSDGMDPASSVFLQQDGTPSPIEGFSDIVQENFQSELQRFENLHTKRMKRQQRKALEQQQQGEGGDDNNDGDDDDLQTNNQTTPASIPLAVAHNPLAAYNFGTGGASSRNTPAPIAKSSSGSEIDKFKLRDHHSPVYGFLYFNTPAGKRRALKQALRVFGVSTASGYAMTTQDALEKNQLVISGLHRSMTGADVANFVRDTLGEHLQLSKELEDKSVINTNALDVQEHATSLSLKGSIVERVYVPRSYARSSGSHDFFNNNRGYAIITFDNHQSAFDAFRYLQNSTISFAPTTTTTTQLPLAPEGGEQQYDAVSVDKIDANFNLGTINQGFAPQASTINESTPTPSLSRVVNVHWRKEKSRPQKQQHPITSYFPTFERPKQHLFHKVSQQLRAALPSLPSQQQAIEEAKTM